MRKAFMAFVVGTGHCFSSGAANNSVPLSFEPGEGHELIATSIVHPVFCLWSTPAARATGDFNCPKNISTKQSIPHLPPGWSGVKGPRAVASNSLALKEVKFYLQQSRQAIRLSPREENPYGVETWAFGKNGGDQILEVCSYYDTVIEIERELPRQIKSCTVKHPELEAQSRENNPEGPISSIDCR